MAFWDGQLLPIKGCVCLPSVALFRVILMSHIAARSRELHFSKPIQTEVPPPAPSPCLLPSLFEESTLRSRCHASPSSSNELQRKRGAETLAALGRAGCIKILESDLWPVSIASSRQTTLCKQMPFRHLYRPCGRDGWQAGALKP